MKNKNFTFDSKANVLEYLQKKVKKSKIEKMYFFTEYDWKYNKNSILNEIPIYFSKQKTIVRSSAKGEDSEENSKAGVYDSFLNIDSNSKIDVSKSIENVINSYAKKSNQNIDNQILIQKQTTQVLRSGVIFSRIISSGSPYYVINFDESSSTDNVTKGNVGNLIKIFRNTPISKIPNKWRKLILAVKEIEKLLCNDTLDIEFAINKKSVIIFQVRPITSIKNYKKNKDHKIEKLIKKNINYFSNLKSIKKFHKEVLFSDMSDWNPSEIIGTDPNLLDYSIYDYLIMKNSWHKGRTLLGYQKIVYPNLMIKFGNKPYVDLNTSFLSLIPELIPKNITKKLMKYYFNQIKKYPSLHDKIEFSITFSSYDLSTPDRIKNLKKFGFNNNEIKTLQSNLIIFTKNILLNFPKLNDFCENSISLLTRNRQKILDDLNKNSHNNTLLIESIQKLLIDCRELGTIPFSAMARVAFIGNSFLKSMVETGYITNSESEYILNSIESPLTHFRDDVTYFQNQKITETQFLKKYGHLRPGTYDITIDQYNKNHTFLNNISISLKPNSKITKNINKKIKKEKILDYDYDYIILFIKNSLKKREEIKFEFTKNISIALELIIKIGNSLGFMPNDMAYLDLASILSSKNLNRNKIIKKWSSKINKEKSRRNLTSFITLPPLIFNKIDFNVITYPSSTPNYITNKKIVGKIISLSGHDVKLPDLENNVILIENADPGFDWIFTKNPLGLITKYGGVASHMAIRCAELGLPAAIGCGEMIFDKLITSSKISLDCKLAQILILENKIDDEDEEVKKVLKSLGYIK